MKIRTKKKEKTIRKIITIAVFVSVITVFYLLGRLLPAGIADYYSSEVFPYLGSGPQRLGALTGFSLTEISVVIVGCLSVPLFILWIVLLIKKALTRGIGKFLYQSLRNTLAVMMVVLIVFEVLFGFNYRRTPARIMLRLGMEKLSVRDLCAAYEWAYEGMIKARSELKEDEKGVAMMSSDFEGAAEYASYVVDTFCASYGLAAYKGYTRAKSVRLSHYWSWTYIVGLYNPAYGEANVNTDYMDITSIPTTICHELCHGKGFSNETDCNLISVLACITSDRADFRYSGYYTIFISLLAEISKIIKTYNFEYDTRISDPVIVPVARDIKAAVDYWKSIDAEVLDFQKRMGINVTEQAMAANNKFLETNGEKGGIETYNVPENAYVDFYLKYVLAKGGANA